MKMQKTWDKSPVHSRFQITARNITNVQFNFLWAKNHFLTFLICFCGCCIAYILQLTFRKFIWNTFQRPFRGFLRNKNFPNNFWWEKKKWNCQWRPWIAWTFVSTMPFLKLRFINIIFHCCYHVATLTWFVHESLLIFQTDRWCR